MLHLVIKSKYFKKMIIREISNIPMMFILLKYFYLEHCARNNFTDDIF